MPADAAPAIDLFSVPTLKDPWDAYRHLRDHDPVHFVPAMNLHVVTRYDLVRIALKDTRTYSSRFDGFLGAAQQMLFAQAPPAIQQALVRINAGMVPIPPTMLTLDEPDHTRYRSLVGKLFTAGEIRRAEPNVRTVIDETLAAIDAAVDAGRTHDLDIDFMAAFAFPVPLRIIADRLGIPEADRPFFDHAATGAAGNLRLTPLTPEQMVERAQTALDLQKLLIRLVDERRREPRADMISILANSRLDDEQRLLTHGECLSILNQFLVAGHETTTSTFGWGMLLLCQNPAVQEALHAAPGRVRTFVEEVLRLEAPVQGLPRVVTRDTVLGGTPLPAGSMVMLRYGAANRDERQFDNPDRLDIHRDKAGQQLAFGSGVHHCIGAPLARQELTLGFPALLARMRNIRLVPGAPPPEAEASFILRNLPHLHIRFDRR